MEKVTGIGGVFAKSKDPARLRAWYAEHLGLPLTEWGGATFSWGGDGSERGETVWAIFEAESDYFAPTSAGHMVNYRVRDLAAMLAQLRAAGVAVDDKTHSDENGKFGWARDCDGNRFELWEPPATP